MDKPIFIDDHFMDDHTSYKDLVEALRLAFSSKKIVYPMRHHHDFKGTSAGSTNTLLLMPAWETDKDLGIKLITVNPDNQKVKLPTIQGTYLFMEARTGNLKALLDAKTLTLKRTAATSALASSILSRTDASILLILGTGALAPHLIEAHATVRPLQKVLVWGRDFQKAQDICKKLSGKSHEINAVKDYQSVISSSDIISTATLSQQALLLGDQLCAGQHIDLVGSYKPDMREADNQTMQRAAVYVDSREAGFKESGDLLIPLQEKAIKESDVKADLFQLCAGSKTGRKNTEQITLFKSVGLALEDLVAANYFYKQFTSKQ